MFSKLSHILSWALLASQTLAVDPVEVYDGDGAAKDAPIALKIGNGGAGQSGLVGALSNAFIKSAIKNGSEPFRVAWYKSDTTQSINYLKAKIVDVGITYTLSAEEVAVEADIVKDPIYYLFRDHFLVVGPPENPAKLSSDDDTKTIFAKLYASAERGDTTPPTRFLSRYDKSATNIKDSQLWINIGQTPWANPTSIWYHQYIQYPIQALTAAADLKEYTITDRGTILSLNKTVADRTTIYKAAEDDESDPLLNPAHLLIGTHAPPISNNFTDWALGPGGQDVIANFEKGGKKLYTVAPANKTIPVKRVAKTEGIRVPGVIVGNGSDESKGTKVSDKLNGRGKDGMQVVINFKG